MDELDSRASRSFPDNPPVPAVPPRALAAAAEALRRAGWQGSPESMAAIILFAAAPHMAAAEIKRLRTELEHAKSALAGDNEGIRLWMLDCGELVAKHRARADEAAAAERERIARWLEAKAAEGGIPVTLQTAAAIIRNGLPPQEAARER